MIRTDPIHIAMIMPMNTASIAIVPTPMRPDDFVDPGSFTCGLAGELSVMRLQTFHGRFSDDRWLLVPM
jgi:hypothetical protein